MTEQKELIVRFGKLVDLAQYDYNIYAKYYDIIELKPEYVESINRPIDKLLRVYRVRTVHDITCVTGAQISYLAEKGYVVSGSDINGSMLGIAKERTQDKQIPLTTGDMRSTRFGLFDAVISIFNSIGHLSRDDFEKMISNVYQNLKKYGIFLFDIFNLDYVLKDKMVGYDFIDTAFSKDGKIYVRFNNVSIEDDTGMAHINQRTYNQEKLKKPDVIVQDWDMQLYTSNQLDKMLLKNGFTDVQFLSEDGKSFNKDDSYSIFVVACL